MKSHSCGWRTGRHNLGHRAFGQWSHWARRGKARIADENNQGATNSSYWTYVADAASLEAYKRQDGPPEESVLLSAETISENSSILGIRSFVQDFPEKIFPLIYKLRPEFQELFIEYHVLGKSQKFLAKAHQLVQSGWPLGVWQQLRIAEQAIGALLILGAEPEAKTLRPILIANKLETSEYGSLTAMFLIYAKSQSYAVVAKAMHAPIPAVRKIFRPAIKTLLTAKDVKSAAVGAWMRSLTHQASLTGAGLSRKCVLRMRNINKHIYAPPAENSPLINFNNTASLKDAPWCMFEIDSNHLIDHIIPALRNTGRRIFGKKPAQIFAPLDNNNELQYGYIFARSLTPAIARGVTKILGVGEMSASYDDDGVFKSVVTVPDSDVQKLIDQQLVPSAESVRMNDFVQILTGEGMKYCGTIVDAYENGNFKIEINFPTGRRLTVTADPTSIKVLKVPTNQRAFWGRKI